MRVALIGPGDIELHYRKILKLSDRELKSELEKIAESLVSSGVELEFLPDRGVSFELAKLYKQKGGKRVIATLPKSDVEIGIDHLKPYLDEKVSGKPLFDEVIDSQNWWKHDILKGLFGNAILYLGSTFGTDLERCGSLYMLRILQGSKKGVRTSAKSLNPHLQADENFTLFVYSPFVITGKIPREHERYCEEYGIKLVYIKDSEQLKRELIKINL